MFRLLFGILVLSFLFGSALGQQTETVPDPAGSTNSVVEVISIDPDTQEVTTIILSVAFV